MFMLLMYKEKIMEDKMILKDFINVIIAILFIVFEGAVLTIYTNDRTVSL